MRGARRALAVFWVAAAIGCNDGNRTSVITGDLQATTVPDFGHVVLGRSTSTHVQLTNVSRAPLTLQEIALELPVFGDYTVDGDAVDSQAPFTLQAGASREIEVGFAPKMVGPRVGKLDLHNNGKSALVVLDLSGTGVLGEATFAPQSLNFGDVGIGSSYTLPITFTNSAVDPAYITVGAPTGPNASAFTGTPSGSLTLPPNSTLAVNVTFRPSFMGSQTGMISVQPCPICGAVEVPLTGIGIAADLTVAPDPVAFAPTLPGQSLTQSVVVTNNGTRPATLSPGTLDSGTSAEITVAPTATVTLAQNQTASFVITFAPTQTGAVTGQLRVPTDDTGQPVLLVPITAAGIGPAIQVAPTALGFPQTSTGIQVTKTISVRNVGFDPTNMYPLVVSNVAITPGPFTVAPGVPLPMTLDAGREQYLYVTYSPTAAEKDTATVTITSNDPVHPTLTVPITGSAVLALPCGYTVLPPQLNFGSVNVGANVQLNFGIENTSANPCTFANIQLSATSDPAFAMSPISTRTINPGDTQLVPVEAAPTSAGTFTGEVDFDSDAQSAPRGTVPLSVNGVPACLTVQPPTLNFGSVGLMCGAPTLQAQVSNGCGVTVNIAQSSIGTGPSTAFSVTPGTAGMTALAPGAQTLITVVYTPTVAETDDNALFIQTDYQPAPYVVPLTGTAEAQPMNTDTFTEPAVQKVDVLWIVDNSGSMSNKQAQLAANAGTFIDKAVASGMDFQVAVTTTGIEPFTGGVTQCPGGAEGGEAGRFFPVDDSQPRILTATTPNVQQVFASDAMVGICHYIEEGMTAMQLALSPPLITDAKDPGTPFPADGNLGFLRPDARLYVIWVTDEDDMVPDPTSPIGKTQNPTPVQYYVDFLESLKPGRPDLVSASAVIGLPGSCGGDIDGVGTRYIQFVQEMGGQIADICSSDWSGVINDLADSAFQPELDFPLSEAPNGRTVTVTVNGVPVPATGANGQVNWTFDPTIGSYGAVVFSASDAPGPNAVVTITYPTPCPTTVP